MNFKCQVTEVTLAKPCSVATCMWSSVKNSSRCMCDKGVLEPEDVNDAMLARHKGITLAEVSRLRLEGDKRIASLVNVTNLFDWAAARSDVQPWSDTYSNSMMAKAVNNWCTQHWVFSVPELQWSIPRVALCVHRPTLLRFNAHVGKQIDWLSLLGLTADAANEIVSIFKSYSRRK